ncbi:MAG: transcription termination/antitermination protein NusG [Actinomycetota bacterium]|nr:transcription termination/antitermination protein NusG [Actinomycetota bacterium]
MDRDEMQNDPGTPSDEESLLPDQDATPAEQQGAPDEPNTAGVESIDELSFAQTPEEEVSAHVDEVPDDERAREQAADEKTTSDEAPEDERALEAAYVASAEPVTSEMPLGDAEQESAEEQAPLEVSASEAPGIVEEPQPFKEAAPEIEEPAAEIEEPAAEVEEPTAEVEEPTAEIEQPAAETEEPAVDEPALVPSPELAAAVDEAFAEAGADEEAEEALDWQPGEWFVVHTYAGYENKVKTNLESRIVSMNMEEKIYEVVIPVEDVMEVKSGKKQVVQRKVFPGYLLVRMDLNDDSWYVVRNTPGVTGFVGSGTKPIPLSEKEVDRVLQRKGPEERPKPRLEFSSGDNVRVVTGPFANFQGIISDIDVDRSKLKVLVNIFGRETPVELGFDQVAKV